MKFDEFLQLINNIKIGMHKAIQKKLFNQFGICEKTSNELIDLMKKQENLDIFNIYTRNYWDSGEQDKFYLQDSFFRNISEKDFQDLSKLIEDLKQATEM